MANISIDTNLAQLKHVEKEFTTKEGKKVLCMILPYEENNIFVGGKVRSLKMTGIEIKDRSKFKDTDKTTHLIKQDIPKEKYDAMTDEQKKALPILGNAVYWGKREAAPVASATIAEDDLNVEVDDLPF